MCFQVSLHFIRTLSKLSMKTSVAKRQLQVSTVRAFFACRMKYLCGFVFADKPSLLSSGRAYFT
jgi:hypothetical protein